MKKLVLFFCLSVAIAAQAQKQKTESYVETYRELAIREMIRTGVPAAITLAQGILESQSGESDLVKGSNNHFGIKCKTEWTGEKIYHDDDAKGECFRVYPTAEDSYKDHSDFLKTRPNYAFLFKLDPTDFEGWAKGLKKAGYATNPAYPQKLMKLINDFGLQQYSIEAMARLKNGDLPAIAETVAANVAGNTAAIMNAPVQAAVSANTLANAAPETEKTPVQGAGSLREKKVVYPSGVFIINHTKVIYSVSGTSMLSLANRFDLPLGKLLEYNDLPEMDVLDTDRLVFIEKKQKKGASDFHTVAEGETLHDICQSEGIRLENLMTYNNISKSRPVLKGGKLYLRPATASANTKTQGTKKAG